MTALYQRASLLFVFGLLAACQTIPDSVPRLEQWLTDPSHFSDFELPSQWLYQAKVGIKVDGKAEQANLNWQRDAANNSQVRLFGPLGAGAVRLEFNPYSAQLTDNKGKVYRGVSAEQLLSDIVGWPLPFAALQAWAFGQPATDAAFDYQLDELGQLAVLRQKGWQIEYRDWRDYQGTLLPRRITASAHSAKTGQFTEVQVKLITRSWQW